MELAPILERLRKSTDLTMAEFRPSVDALRAYLRQTTVRIAMVLSKYVKEFAKSPEIAKFKYYPRRPLPLGVKNRFYPLRVCQIEEATIKGNLLLHDDIFLTQLQQLPQRLCRYALPSWNDQLTNARIRGCKAKRWGDSNEWTRREIFQLGLALFHLLMNLIWGILRIHRGSALESASLTYFFVIMDKTRLGGEKPDFHTLHAALIQILDGIILSAWQCECGFSTLQEFAASAPTSSQLEEIASRILLNHLSPKPPSAGPSPQTANDTVHQNLRMLARDLLYVAELTEAVSSGDFGRVEDILPDLAAIFRAAGSNNYSTEILHFLFNLKKVWTPEFA